MNEIADVEGTIRDYLAQMYHMSLGTCVDGKPWVCEVHYAADDEMNLYFRSSEDRRHCQEIAINPNVAGNIATTHGLSDKPRGIYFEGTAELLHDVSEFDVAYTAYSKRLGLGLEILEDALSREGTKFYKITVSDWYLFDTRESKPSRKYHLPMHRS